MYKFGFNTNIRRKTIYYRRKKTLTQFLIYKNQCKRQCLFIIHRWIMCAYYIKKSNFILIIYNI